MHYGVGDCLLVALDMPVTSRITHASEAEPHLCVGMAINADVLAELISRLPPETAAPTGGVRGVALNAASPQLLDATLRFLRLLDRPRDVAALAPLIEQEILYHLLTGPHGARLLHVALAEGQGHRITRAVAWLRDHFAQTLRIEALAEHLGMSGGSLHHRFKAVTGMTPMQYQKQLRLYEARRLMLVEGGWMSGRPATGRVPEPVAVQPGISPPVRPVARPRRRSPACAAGGRVGRLERSRVDRHSIRQKSFAFLGLVPRTQAGGRFGLSEWMRPSGRDLPPTQLFLNPGSWAQGPGKRDLRALASKLNGDFA
ncbi:AraC family transcriptional regulator N-terminal domain-containing protein [Caulobacter segnis]